MIHRELRSECKNSYSPANRAAAVGLDEVWREAEREVSARTQSPLTVRRLRRRIAVMRCHLIVEGELEGASMGRRERERSIGASV